MRIIFETFMVNLTASSVIVSAAICDIFTDRTVIDDFDFCKRRKIREQRIKQI